jgi:hypothetical protein
MSDKPTPEQLRYIRENNLEKTLNLGLGTDEQLLGREVIVTMKDATEVPGIVVDFSGEKHFKCSALLLVKNDLGVIMAGRAFVRSVLEA